MQISDMTQNLNMNLVAFTNSFIIHLKKIEISVNFTRKGTGCNWLV